MHIKKRQELLNHYKVFIHSTDQLEKKAIIGLDGIVLLSNDENLTFSLKEGSVLSAAFPKNLRDLSAKRLNQIAQSGIGKSFYVEKKDKEADQWFQMLINPVTVKGDADPLFMVQLIDISHFKKIEKESEKQRTRVEHEMLLRTQEIVQTSLFVKENGGYLSNFMRGLRHDLLSPIAQLKEIISYYLEAEEPKKRQRAGEYVDDCINKLNNTAKGFSDFVDLHILPQRGMEAIQLEAVFDDTKAILGNAISQSKARITTDFSKGPSIYFNEKIISSILYNLLSNAIKFKKEGVAPVIEIHTYEEDANFILTIKDNGTGIDLEKYGHKLFVPFKRLNMDRPGAGVGLSMIKNILTRYEGDIQMESEVGIGSNVLVRIPIISL